MGREYAQLGATSADLLNTLMGGGGQRATGYAAGSTDGANIAYKQAQRSKLDADTQKILAELSATKAAEGMTGAELGPMLGFNPEQFRQVMRQTETGKYDAPYELSEAEYFPGEDVSALEQGLTSETLERPQGLTPMVEQGVRTAAGMPALRKLSEGRGSIDEFMRALTGASTMTTQREMMPDKMTTGGVAPVMAALAGKDPTFKSSKSGEPTNIETLRILMAPKEKGGFGLTENQAMEIAFNSGAGEFMRSLVEASTRSGRPPSEEDFVEFENLIKKLYPDYESTTPAVAPPGNVIKVYK